MAYIVRSTTEVFDVAALTATPALPEHASGDLILCCVTQDGGTGTISTGSTGWSIIGTQAGSGGARQVWAWRVAASSSEPDPVFSSTLSEDWVINTIIIKDADTTTPIHANVRVDFNNPVNGVIAVPTTTYTNNNLLVFYSIGSDGAPLTLVNKSDATYVERQVGLGVTSEVTWRNAYTAAASPAFNVIQTVSTEGGNVWLIAINNATGGALAGECRESSQWIRTYGAANWGRNFSALSTLAATIGGLPTLATVPAVTTVSLPEIFGSGDSLTFTGAPASPSWMGAIDTLSSVVDLTGRNISIKFRSTTAMANDRLRANGFFFVIADTSGNYIVYQLIRQRPYYAANQTFVFVCTPNQGTIFASSGTLDLTQVNRFGYFVERQVGTTTTSNLTIKDLELHSRTTLTGGGTNKRAVVEDIANANQNGAISFGMLSFQGTGQLLRKQPIRLGNGTTPSNISFSGQSVELPLTSQLFTRSLVQNYVAGSNTAGIEIFASSACTIDLSSCVLVTPQINPFTIDASSSTSATYSFQGLTLSGYDVTWKTGIPVRGITFTRCRNIDLKNNTIENNVFTGTTDATGILIEAGSTLRNNSFIARQSSDYALEIASAGSFVFDGNTYSGYTNVINVTATTGTVNITLSVGDTVPTFTTAGATVNIIAPTVDITATISAGSRVQIYNVTTNTEIDNVVEPTSSYSYTVTTEATNGDTIRIRVTKLGLLPFEGQAIFSGTAGASFFVSQPTDTVYVANGVNGSTVTEFVEDFPNVQVDIDDPDGETSIVRLYAWYTFVLTSANGIRQWFGGILAEDQANYKVNSSILNLKLDNIRTTGVIFTGGLRLYRTDGAIPVVTSTTGGGSIVLYSDKVFIAETGTSGLTPSEAATLSKIDTLTEDVSGLRFTAKALEETRKAVPEVGLIPATI